MNRARRVGRWVRGKWDGIKKKMTGEKRQLINDQNERQAHVGLKRPHNKMPSDTMYYIGYQTRRNYVLCKADNNEKPDERDPHDKTYTLRSRPRYCQYHAIKIDLEEHVIIPVTYNDCDFYRMKRSQCNFKPNFADEMKTIEAKYMELSRSHNTPESHARHQVVDFLEYYMTRHYKFLAKMGNGLPKALAC
jgi:hypothetical protein